MIKTQRNELIVKTEDCQVGRTKNLLTSYKN